MPQGIQITLSVKDDGTATIQKVSGEMTKMETAAAGTANKVSGEFKKMETAASGSASTMTSAFDQVKQNWLGLTAAVAGAAIVLRKAWNLAETAATFEESVGRINVQLREHGTSAKALIPVLQDLAHGQLSLRDAVQLSSRALAVGIDTTQLKTLVALADQVGDVMGTSVPQALDFLTNSIAGVNDRALKQAGIYVDLTPKVQQYALASGKSAEAVTQEEKQMVLLKAVMEAANPILAKAAENTSTTADSMAALKARMDDLQLSMGLVVGALPGLAFGLAQLAASAATLLAALNPITLALNAVGIISDETFEAMLASTQDLAKKGWTTLTDSMQTAVGKGLDPLTGATAALTDEQIRQQQVTKISADFWAELAAREKQAADAAAKLHPVLKDETEFFRQLKAEIERVISALGSLHNVHLEAFTLAKAAIGGAGLRQGPPFSNVPPQGLPLDNPQDLLITPPDISPTPFAQGGLVRRPTLALIGEREPELVIPTSKLRSGGTTISLIFNVSGASDPRAFARTAARELHRVLQE